MAPDRVDFTEDGKLDEIVSTKGAHLECMGGANWFLEFHHEYGALVHLPQPSKALYGKARGTQGLWKQCG